MSDGPFRRLHTKERELTRALLAKGWTLRYLRNGHLRLEHPGGVHSVVIPGTPSDWRSWRNFRADVRRIERATQD
jgi:predicted RNA binding protein YcfA (HicA-like mRNA interferase family)